MGSFSHTGISEGRRDAEVARERRVEGATSCVMTFPLRLALKIQNVRFQYRTILVPGRPERSFKEHSAIVEAVAAHDAEAAEAAVRTHLSHVREALRQTRHAHNNQFHMHATAIAFSTGRE
jgi:FCD domain